ncbi:MAG: repair protein RecN [Bacteroidota bacterium]|jgi:DNA repair protein RecN (Recombination protein N)
MLQRLHIAKFALIDHLDLEVGPGFTVVTGETGAGKSIFLGALQLALGGRAEFSQIGQPGHKCVVEAEFRVPQGRQSELSSTDWDWWPEDGTATLLLRREVLPGGRSRAFINDSPVRLDELKRISTALVDIHSQRDEGLWARNEGIVLLLEAFAKPDVDALRAQYAAAWLAYREAQQRSAELEADLGHVTDPEYLKFVVEEWQALRIQPNEVAALRAQLSVLGNAQELGEVSTQALSAIDREDLGFEAQAAELRRLAERVQRLGRPSDELVAVSYSLEENVRALRDAWTDVLDGMDSDPGALERTEARFAELDRILRKHQCADEAELDEKMSELDRRLQRWSDGQALRAQAQAQVAQALSEVTAAGERWNTALMTGAAPLAKAVAEGLQGLAMPSTQLEVTSERRAQPSANGCFSYRLAFSANPGQALQDLSKVASGGERSRLMLVLKRYLAQKQGLSTVLFDEIDTGVSGGTATKMAQMLRAMAQDAQVIAITHLPQVAALGAQHWVVEKSVAGGTSQTVLRTLESRERPAEVARLLSDGSVSELALAQAEALMATAQ